MDEPINLTWSALEYEEKERSKDWFFALGIIVITSTITAIIFENYFFAVILLLGGGLLGFFAKKKPNVLAYTLDEKGLHIGMRLYPYEDIKAFWVQLNKGETGAMFFVKAEKLFMPIVSIPIEYAWAEEVRDIMLEKNIPEIEMREHLSEKIMESLGF